MTKTDGDALMSAACGSRAGGYAIPADTASFLFLFLFRFSFAYNHSLTPPLPRNLVIAPHLHTHLPSVRTNDPYADG